MAGVRALPRIRKALPRRRPSPSGMGPAGIEGARERRVVKSGAKVARSGLNGKGRGGVRARLANTSGGVPREVLAGRGVGKGRAATQGSSANVRELGTAPSPAWWGGLKQQGGIRVHREDSGGGGRARRSR